MNVDINEHYILNEDWDELHNCTEYRIICLDDDYIVGLYDFEGDYEYPRNYNDREAIRYFADRITK